jgi:hypothetical protein
MDILHSWLFGKVEIWGIKKADSAIKAMLDCYGVTAGVESKLEIIAAQQSETLILHEVGEALAEPLLGEAWNEMVSSFQMRRCELIARAVRDNLADCIVTLPEIIKSKESCSLHFYFSIFEGLRRSIFPSLVEGYEHWLRSGDVAELQNVIESGREHWLKVARQLLAEWVNNPTQAEEIIGSYGVTDSRIML